jgi:membrane-associated phospholipid phosphatase
MKYVFLILSFLIPATSFSQNADINVLRTINSNGSPFMDKGFKAITNSATPVAIAIPVGVLLTGIIRKDKKAEGNGLQIGATLVVGAGISEITKYVVNRPRPFVTYPFIKQKTDVNSQSFPSGHTTLAFAAATSFSICYPKWYVIVPSYLWACSVAYSRMYLGVHYPSDVLAGMVIGSGSAWLVYKIRKGIYKRQHDYDNRVPKF